MPLKLRFKQKLDFYLGGALVLCLQPLVMLAGQLLRRDHSLEPQGALLFIKLQGGGSLVLAYPALLGLRRKHKHRRFMLLTTPAVSSFAATLGIFDEILVLDDGGVVKLMASGLQCLWAARRADTIVDLEVYSRLSGLFAVLSGARNRLGFYIQSFQWRRGFYTHLVFFNRFSGSFHFYEQLARLLGAGPADLAECRAHFSRVMELPEAERARCDVIAVGAGCSELGYERMLTAEQWRKAASARLSPDYDGEIRLLGARGDRAQSREIIDLLQPSLPKARFRNECGQCSLSESLGMLWRAREFWGIDSALLHYARLFGLRCVSYWGPTDPGSRLKPVPQEDVVHYRKIPCSPCIHVAEEPPCCGNNVCIDANFREALKDVELPVFVPYTRSQD